MGVRASIGAFGEEFAVRYLAELGFVILDRNWRCGDGEIDVVALDGDVIVICEVKTRSGFGFGSGLEAITREKGARLRRLAMRWLEASGRSQSIRIDVIAVHRRSDGPPRIEHERGAI